MCFVKDEVRWNCKDDIGDQQIARLAAYKM